jgi:hypothetical protein
MSKIQVTNINDLSDNASLITQSGGIKTDKLTGNTTAGSILVTVSGSSATTNLQQGLVKCWLDATSGNSIADSFNIASISDDGTAINTYSFTNDFGSAHYGMGCCHGLAGGNNGADSRIKAEAAGSIQVQTTYNDSTVYEWGMQKYMWIGDLA